MSTNKTMINEAREPDTCVFFDVVGVGPATVRCLREADAASVRADLMSTADARWQCSHSRSIQCEPDVWTVQVQEYEGIEEDLDHDPSVVVYGKSE